MRAVLRLILGDPDGRSPREISRDVEDELSSHVAMIEDELMREGLDTEAARAEARRRFGDPDRYRRECRDIALWERLMLQRISFALMLVITLALGLAAWQSWASQRRTTEAVDRLSKQIELLASRSAAGVAAGSEGAVAPAGARRESESSVFVAGAVPRPGPYNVPTAGLSLRRLAVASGFSGPVFEARIERPKADGQKETINVAAAELVAGTDPLIRAGDLVYILHYFSAAEVQPNDAGRPEPRAYLVYASIGGSGREIVLPTTGRATLTRVLSKEIGQLPERVVVEIRRLDKADRLVPVFSATAQALGSDPLVDIEVQPEDRIILLENSQAELSCVLWGGERPKLLWDASSAEDPIPTLRSALAERGVLPCLVEEVTIDRLVGSEARKVEYRGHQLSDAVLDEPLRNRDFIKITPLAADTWPPGVSAASFTIEAPALNRLGQPSTNQLVGYAFGRLPRQVTIREAVASLSPRAFRSISWRNGTRSQLAVTEDGEAAAVERWFVDATNLEDPAWDTLITGETVIHASSLSPEAHAKYLKHRLVR